MTLGVGAILSAEPADIVRRLTFATKEAAAPHHADLFHAMARVNLAHAIMLHEKGLVPKETSVALVGLMLEIFHGGPSTVPLKAENGDLYPQIEAYAASRLGGDTAGYLQLGRSRGDVIPSTMRIKLRMKQARLLEAQLALRSTLLDSCERYAETIMPAYTHWQQSQVMTLGHFLGRFAAWFERDTDRLWFCLNRHNLSVLGCANGVGTSVKVDRDATSDLLGHDAPVASAGDAVNAWDYMIEPVSEAALFCSHLARLMGNFILWHTQEFGMARLSDAFSTASTYLPQKRNPEPLETVKVFAEQVQGSLATVYLMARNEDWPHSLINHGFDAMNQALDLSTDAATLTSAILEDIEFDTARMSALLSEGFTTASEVANTLVTACSIPFREAHEIVGLAVRSCLEAKLSKLDAAHVRRAASDCGFPDLGIDDATLDRSINPAEFIHRMDSPGGVAPEETRKLIAQWRAALDDDRNEFEAFKQRIARADAQLVSRARAIAAPAQASSATRS
ncbi:argininosuccinate lyase [Parapusillimonas sp. SGNA-6]|nr:argininosuccinate lyase [Parapusillimonas sp. SGNA-6]